EFDRTFATRRMKAVCTYPLEASRADEVVDVIQNHGYALIKRGAWELIENSQRRRAEEAALEKAMAKLDQRVRARTRQLQKTNQKLLSEIGERRRAEGRLRESREQLRALVVYLQSVRE